MMALTTYGIAAILFILSFIKSKEKTKRAFQFATKSFLKIAPSILTLVGVVGLVLGILTPQLISSFLGEEAGFLGTIAAALIGGITLIPAVIAFPLAGTLYHSGASIMTVSAFVTSLVMVGVVTLPIEIRTFGKKFALLRNAISFVSALLIAWLMGSIL